MQVRGKFIFREDQQPREGSITDLYCGNVAVLLSETSRLNVGCWITSPPYYRQRRYTDSPYEIGTEGSVEEYLQIFHSLARLFHYHSRAGATFWMVIGDTRNMSGGQGGDYRKPDGSYRLTKWEGAREEDPPTALLRIPQRMTEVFVKAGWMLVNDVILNKNTSRRSAPRRLCDSYEHLLVFAKDSGYRIRRDMVFQRFSSETLKQMGNVAAQKTKREILEGIKGRPGAYLRDCWDISPVGRRLKGIQPPAPFPPLVAHATVVLGSRPDDLVCDPFCGYGEPISTAVGYGRDVMGIDLDPQGIEATRDKIKTLWNKEVRIVNYEERDEEREGGERKEKNRKRSA